MTRFRFSAAQFIADTSSFSLRSLAGALISVTVLTACGGGSAPTQVAAGDADNMSAAARLGEKIFKDPSLSASGKMSCASCHDPSAAHAQTNNLAVQLGGPNLDQQGLRAVPSLRYLHLTPAFGKNAEGDFVGGFTHDGRADTLAKQAEAPLLAANEMANTDRADVVAKLQRAAYATEFKAVFGNQIFSQTDAAFERILFSLQQYQKEDPDFHPYDSKFDYFMAGKAKFSDAELRGLVLFNNPQKGNCAACHVSARGSDGSLPVFTDYTYDNLGVPRNLKLAANADANFYDLGLCGPNRQDLAANAALCGKFKVPTLRNVATRKVFFHNGVITSLRDAVNFYVTRDTNPENWFPLMADGSVIKFNDVPALYAANVNTSEVPYNRKRGMAPALSPQEVDDVLAFLATLNDGYKP